MAKNRKKKRFKKKKGTPGLKTGCIDFLADWPEFKADAEASGLQARYSQVDCNRHGSKTIHVMLDADDKRLLNYWPGNGRVWEPISGKKSKVADWWEALTLAQDIAEVEWANNQGGDALTMHEDRQTARELGWT